MRSISISSFIRPGWLGLCCILLVCFGCRPKQAKQPDEKIATETVPTPTGQEAGPAWTLGPFVKQDTNNPIMVPLATSRFYCPVRRDSVKWEEKDVFNPTAVVREGKVYLVYRAEDKVGKYAGTSRLGLAVSNDGFTFRRLPTPVLYPDNDFMKPYEWEGGCEDPRIVETAAGTYLLTYTAYDGKTARLCVATSTDLKTWKKHGLAFGQAYGGKYKDLWSKSGSVVARREGNRLVATKINGKYWMYWGDTNMFVATSDNLLDWTPLEEKGRLVAAFGPRKGMFDSRLVEPGPAAMITGKGILLIYNSMNLDQGGDPDLAPGTYSAGQILLDTKDPVRVLERTDTYFMKPDKAYEITGQVGNVCFLEGLVHFGGKWLLYYGTADSKIAAASYDPAGAHLKD
jgi:beta-1,2-mannosidase